METLIVAKYFSIKKFGNLLTGYVFIGTGTFFAGQKQQITNFKNLITILQITSHCFLEKSMFRYNVILILMCKLNVFTTQI